MEQHRNYTKAPITEALIDLRVELPLEISLATLDKLKQSLSQDYPICMPMNLSQGQFQIGPGNVTTATAVQSPVGYRFSNEDETQVLQARLDGFTFSQLAPYKNWDSLRDEAYRLWKLYSQVAQPKVVKRVAVRYINRLELPVEPSKTLELKDYLHTFPEVSSKLPDFNDYFLQLQFPQQDLSALLILNQAIIPPSRENVVSVLLDIDLFSENEFPATGEQAWTLLGEFRGRKNQIFEACVTDKTRKLIE